MRRGAAGLLAGTLLGAAALGAAVLSVRALEPGEGLPGWFLGAVVLVPAALSTAGVLIGHRLAVRDAEAELE